jgi:hypothetical protein
MPLSADFDLNYRGLDEPTRQFVTLIVAAFPDWAGALEFPESRQDSIQEDCWFCVVPPGHPTHRLYVAALGDSVEIRYDDGEPPGPAERMLVRLDRDPAAVAEGVVAFVRDLTSGRVVVARERLDWFGRLIRRDCKSLVWFREASDLVGRTGTVAAVYRWDGAE